MRNIALGRPAAQITTYSKNVAGLAVDGDKDNCAMTRKGTVKPWWRVDLGKQVWVEKVLLYSKEYMPGVEIRIGNFYTIFDLF